MREVEWSFHVVTLGKSVRSSYVICVNVFIVKRHFSPG